jgi:RNA polymerase sigma factor (sigma-70 family)
MLAPWKATYSHEDLFIQRYEWLLNWALQLTGRNREQAEDLVHDAFIQFTLTRPDLDSIQNLEGYLYGMLRNMHLSEVRRAARTHNRHISIIDYDSAEIALRSADPWDQIQARDELRAVCNYACARKEKSKAGSVLLLRFFHGYYASEISLVLRSPRRAVDDWLLIARREAKLHLDNPHRSTLSKHIPGTEDYDAGHGQTPSFLSELRYAISLSCCGNCLASEELREIYYSTEAASIDCPILAHIVSCRRCLDKVNELLGLARLSDRYPTDMTGPDIQSKGGSGRSNRPHANSGSQHAKNCRRRVRDTLEHIPKELRISVNGFVLGSQSLGGEQSEQTLNVSMPDKLGFVEVFSEQGIRLLFLNAEPPPDGPAEQAARVELSEGRRLELTLSFSAQWPKLHTVYFDPTSKSAERLKKIALADTSADLKPREEPRRIAIDLDPPGLVSRAKRWVIGLMSRPSPAKVTAILAMLLISITLLVSRRGPSVSAAELLRRASDSEEAVVGKSDLITRRILNLEELNRGDGTLRARRRIEVWLNAAKGIKARRVYDERNRLIAAEWTNSDGSRFVYDRESDLQVHRAPERLAKALLEAGEVWQLELSARDFSSLIGRIDKTALNEIGDKYVIDYHSPLVEGASGLLRARITLNKADLHPLDEALFVRYNGKDLEYRLAEQGFESIPPEKVAPSIFEIDPELVGRTANALEMNGRRTSSTASNSVTELAPLSGAAFGELRVDALYRLHQVGSCIRERASVTRTANGELQIQAIVDNERRRQEVLQALTPVIGAGGVKVEVNTIAEAMSQEMKRPPGPASERKVEITKDRIPVYAELRRYFSEKAERDSIVPEKRPPGEQIDEDIRRFAGRALRLSREALVQAWALKHHAEEISQEQLRLLSPEAKAKWHSMIREHSIAFQQETRNLRLELRPIFFSAVPPDKTSDASEVSNVSDVALAVERVFKLASTQEEAVRKALAISSEGPTTLRIRTDEFWRALKTAEDLARKIQTSNDW